MRASAEFEPVVRELATAIEALRSRRPTPEPERLAPAVAEVLGRRLRSRHWLAPRHQAPGAADYRQHVLYVAPDRGFSITSLVWKPGQATCIHDHVCWCVVGVYRGIETETGYDLCQEDGKAPFLVAKRTRLMWPGDVTVLVPPDEDIHRVACAGDDLAVSIHVYGADIATLGTSINHRFDEVEIRQAPGTARRIGWRESAAAGRASLTTRGA